MGWRRTAMLLGVVALAAACASTPRMTPAERLDFYRAHAGEPVRSFPSPARLWGWRAVGDSALTVWTRRDQGYLLELGTRCTEMPFATSIGLTNRAGLVSAGFDSVLVPRRSGTTGPVSCPIRTIRPLDTRAVHESKRDLHEVDMTNREVESSPGNPE